MEHIIAYNPYKNGNKGSISSQPLSVYDKTIAYPWMADLVAAIRGGNDELKKQLPFRCAHYYQFRDNRRSQKNAVPESFLFQTTIDVDDKEYVDKAIEKARELNCSDTIWNGALLHLEYSARKKLHIDIRMPVGMTIEETQRAYCEALGVPYDESCITPERMLFITDKASEIYRSPHWYEVLPQEELKKRRQAYLDRGHIEYHRAHHHPVQLECIDHRPAGAAIFLKGAHRRTYQPHQLLYHPGAGNRCRNASIRRIRRCLQRGAQTVHRESVQGVG